MMPRHKQKTREARREEEPLIERTFEEHMKSIRKRLVDMIRDLQELARLFPDHEDFLNEIADELMHIVNDIDMYVEGVGGEEW